MFKCSDGITFCHLGRITLALRQGRNRLWLLSSTAYQLSSVSHRYARRSPSPLPRRQPEDINLRRIQSDLEFVIERVSKLPTRRELIRVRIWAALGLCSPR
jgi:hypothetical protein